MHGGQAGRIWVRIGLRSVDGPVTVAHACAAAVADLGTDGAGVSVMVSPTARETMHATDRIAGELEDHQLTFGQGPCVDAFAAGGPVLVGDLDLPPYFDRWPVFTPAARASGARALFALPLQVGAIRLGVFDLYRITPGPLDRDQLADALAYAEAVATLLLDAAEGSAAQDAEQTSRRADPTANRAEVHHATGMVLAQLDVGADEAFLRLRAYAYANDRRLIDVARDVVQRRLRFEPDPPVEDGGG
ncbi:MAG TPA: GAF and ANTAR domain-containing protein [Asanoa sp.]